MKQKFSSFDFDMFDVVDLVFWILKLFDIATRYSVFIVSKYLYFTVLVRTAFFLYHKFLNQFLGRISLFRNLRRNKPF